MAPGNPSWSIEMTEAVQKITLSPSRDIPLEQTGTQTIERSAAHGRKFDRAIRQSITHRSLLQSLNVRPIVEAEGNGTGMLDVPADGLRYPRARTSHDAEANGEGASRSFYRARGGINGDEIISWKLRMFVPTDASGTEIRSKVLDSYPLAPIGEQEAA